jgi:hypothetical protein
VSDAGLIHSTLTAARLDADRLRHAAGYRAEVLGRLAAESDRAFVEARIGRLLALRRDLGDRHDRIQLAYVSLAEAAARIAERFAAIARETPFEPPDWPETERAALELRLSQTTRELTLRVTSAGRAAPDRRGVE